MTTITHNPTAQRFETAIDGHNAYLSYRIVDDDTLDYDHTIVSQALSGRGIGSQLADFALAYAAQHNKQVIASCSFVARYIDKNPAYQKLIKK